MVALYVAPKDHDVHYSLVMPLGADVMLPGQAAQPLAQCHTVASTGLVMLLTLVAPTCALWVITHPYYQVICWSYQKWLQMLRQDLVQNMAQ